MNLEFLQVAIRLSRDKMDANEGRPFGAVVVQNGQIVGSGWNRVTSINDPTAHAEVEAIRDACRRLNTFSLVGCELYSSCEPCPLCLAAIYWSRVNSVYYAATCEDAAVAGFDDKHFYDELRKPAKLRSLPMQQALRDEAVDVLKSRADKKDKTRY